MDQGNGAAGQLCTVFVTAPNYVAASIDNIRIFALHIKATSGVLSDFETNILPNAILSQVYSLPSTTQIKGAVYDFSSGVRTFCASNTCSMEVIDDYSPHVYFLPHCNTEEKNAANKWLKRKFGNVPTTHVEIVCSQKFGLYSHTTSRVIVLAKLRNAPGWDSVTTTLPSDVEIKSYVWVTARVAS